MFSYLLRDTCCFGVSAQPYAFGCSVVTASRCEVAAHAATFCSLVQKTPRARESVDTFEESRDILNQCFTEFLCHPFPVVLFGVSPLREAVFGVPPLRGRGSPSLRETLLVQIPREAWLHKSRSVVKFCDLFQSIAFSLHAWSLFVFLYSAVVDRCVVTRSTTAEFQHNDMMMMTNVQNDLRLEMALEMWIVSVHEKSEQL